MVFYTACGVTLNCATNKSTSIAAMKESVIVDHKGMIISTKDLAFFGSAGKKFSNNVM